MGSAVFFPIPKKPLTFEPSVFLAGLGGGVAALLKMLKLLFVVEAPVIPPPRFDLLSSSVNIENPVDLLFCDVFFVSFFTLFPLDD